MYQVVLVPFPLTPLSAYGYFLGLRFGKISPDAICVYHWRPDSPAIRKAWQSDEILVLMGKDLRVRLDALIKATLPRHERYDFLRLLNFIASPGRGARKNDVADLQRDLNNNWYTPTPALVAASNLFEQMLDRKLNPLQTGLLPCTITSYSVPSTLSIPESKRFLSLPTFDDSPAPLQQQVGFEQTFLIESNATQLMGQHIALVNGGPPSSGKSTATATLVDEINNLISSLRTRVGWEKFDLSVKYVNLDKGTPVGEHILNQRGQDRLLLQSAKREWTSGRAMEGLQDLIIAKQKYNIVIADLPGKIDGFTRLLSCAADGSAIFTNDWDKMNEWKNFFAEMGLPHLAQALTRKPEDGLLSTVKRFRRGRFLSGRVTGLDRVVCSWDPYLHFLAKVLLYDLLPTLVASRQQAIEKIRPSV